MLLCAASCKKENKNENQLPPATQTGANTFGCLVNGKVFVPKGYGSTGRSNPHVQYDYDLNGKPYLSIDARQFINSNNSTGAVNIVFKDIVNTGSYNIPTNFTFSFGWEKFGICGTPAFDTTVQKRGGGIITKLDISNRIISGTFNCKFKHSQCDTVYITDGRFDIKF